MRASECSMQTKNIAKIIVQLISTIMTSLNCTALSKKSNVEALQELQVILITRWHENYCPEICLGTNAQAIKQNNRKRQIFPVSKIIILRVDYFHLFASYIAIQLRKKDTINIKKENCIKNCNNSCILETGQWKILLIGVFLSESFIGISLLQEHIFSLIEMRTISSDQVITKKAILYRRFIHLHVCAHTHVHTH